jgi:hypothetical protein
MRHSIIALAGYKRAGKDTSARLARAQLASGVRVFEYAFADAVRMTCHRVFPDVDRDLWWDDLLKDEKIADLHHQSPRYWIRQIAQAIRALDKNFWATQVLNQISANVEACGTGDGLAIHFIKDLRFEEDWVPVEKRVKDKQYAILFPHEVEAHIWWVDRNLESDGHASEDFTWLGRYDESSYYINNRADEAHLMAAISTVMRQMNLRS